MSEEKKNIPPENDSAQKKPTLEEDIKIYEEAVSIDRSRQKSRRVFVFYIIGLFCVALVLILLSYVMQAHANQELEALGTQLTEQTDAANGARAKVDQLQDSIDKLQADLAEAEWNADQTVRRCCKECRGTGSAVAAGKGISGRGKRYRARDH